MRIIRLNLTDTGMSPQKGDEFYLPLDQARHGALVLRLKEGHKIELTGAEGLATAEVVKAETKGVPTLLVRLTGPWVSAPNNGPRLALALIQNQRFDWALEKAVELGAAEFLPLVTKRTKRQEAFAGEKRQQRWLRLAEEARKQCGRLNSMHISAPVTVSDFLKKNEPGALLSPSGSRQLPAFQSESPWLLVGPEGGFSPEEETAFMDAGYIKWSLGQNILRAETAALAALSKFFL